MRRNVIKWKLYSIFKWFYWFVGFKTVDETAFCLCLVNKMRRKGVNVFLSFLMRFLPRNGANSIPFILLFSYERISLDLDNQDETVFNLKNLSQSFQVKVLYCPKMTKIKRIIWYDSFRFPRMRKDDRQHLNKILARLRPKNVRPHF